MSRKKKAREQDAVPRFARLHKMEMVGDLARLAEYAIGKQAKGAYPVGARVKKVETGEALSDLHPAGSLGTILGSVGPMPALPQDPQWAGKMIIGYFLAWDDLPDLLAFVISPKLELDAQTHPTPAHPGPPEDPEGPSVHGRSSSGQRGPEGG